MIRLPLRWWRDRQRRFLDAARNMEGDCAIGAGAGFGKYTREVSELRRGRRERAASDSTPMPQNPVGNERF